MNMLIRGTQYLQSIPLLERGVLDAIGIAAPMVYYTRTPEERAEKIIDRTITIGAAFCLAPLHALLFRNLIAKWHKLPLKLMDVSFKSLTSQGALSNILKNLQPALTNNKHWQPLAKTSVDVLRRKMIDAKVEMMVPDLIIECLAFGCVGWITNLYSKFKTGKNQFTGELNAVSKEKLVLLQAKDTKYQQSEILRSALTVALSIGIPWGFGAMFKRALKAPLTKDTGKLTRFLKQYAVKFDYKNGIWMGLASLGLVCGVQLIGHVLASRNWREVQEQVIRESALNALFFGGDKVWLKLIHLFIFKPLNIPQYKQVQDIIQKSPIAFKQRNARIGTLAFLASFATNAMALSALIKFINQQSAKRTKEAAQAIPTQYSFTPSTYTLASHL